MSVTQPENRRLLSWIKQELAGKLTAYQESTRLRKRIDTLLVDEVEMSNSHRMETGWLRECRDFFHDHQR